MLVSDLIEELKIDFQEKSTDEKFWDEPQLLVKIKRAYKKIQNDIPYFISNEELLIQEGTKESLLTSESLEAISLKIDDEDYRFCEIDDLSIYKDKKYYSLAQDVLILATDVEKDSQADISYKHLKLLEDVSSKIELPSNYDEALRCLSLSYIYEKSKGNSKERDLSVHYLKRYNAEKEGLKKKRNYTKNITSTYQII